MKKSILVVGAGAVGQVYAYHFAQAGHEVHLFLKQKYIASAQQGFVLYDLRRDKTYRQPIEFKKFHCHASWQSIAKQSIDQVWLCVSSVALAQLDLVAMQQAIGNASIIVLQPDPSDVERVQQVFGTEQVVAGMINMISYSAPLAGEKAAKEGIAFWIPPILPMPVDGVALRLQPVLDLLKSAGIPVTARDNFAAKNVHTSSFLMVFLAALELSDWQFDRLAFNKNLLKIMLQAQHEVFAALTAEYGTQASAVLKMLKPWMVPTMLTLARHIAPLDMERYMQTHFSKVRSQTLLLLQAYQQRAQQHHLPYQALSGLIQQLHAKQPE